MIHTKAYTLSYKTLKKGISYNQIIENIFGIKYMMWLKENLRQELQPSASSSDAG